MKATGWVAILALALLGCVTPGRWACGTHGSGGKMDATSADDLATDDVQGVARRYRAIGPAAVSGLVKALREDARPRVRANAVTALDDIFHFRGGDAGELRGYLLEALGDRAPDVEVRAAEALASGHLGEPGVRAALTPHLPALREAVRATDPIIQQHAASALQALGEQPTAGLLMAANSALRRQGIEQAAANKDVTAGARLCEMAQRDPDLVVRMEAIPVAAALVAPEARDALLGGLIDDADDHIAIAAIRATGTSGAAGLAGRLRSLLDRPDNQRTEATVTALGALHDSAAIPAIAAHLLDRSGNTAWACKLALDGLLGQARSYQQWQQWARQQAYLK